VGWGSGDELGGQEKLGAPEARAPVNVIWGERGSLGRNRSFELRTVSRLVLHDDRSRSRRQDWMTVRDRGDRTGSPKSGPGWHV
jgi:hypothetical protein